MKYSKSVYDGIKEGAGIWDGTITDDDIDKMKRSEVLERWLQWEGIRGYTDAILLIVGIEK